uniref:Uncharacterized protein n=1 Tax=Heligmosomoides polygyrus TaxID=6339 RepID=A0A183F4E5_HELPZ
LWLLTRLPSSLSVSSTSLLSLSSSLLELLEQC